MKQIELEVAVADDRSPVRMDRHELEQILVNLVVNARDAMPGGGRMIVETQVTQVEVDSGDAGLGLRPGEYVTLTVSDTGSGMGAAVAERAFEPFFTTKPTGEGSGLGLSTVYGIVAHAGGRVVLDSEPDRGTVVRVHLPASALDDDASAEPQGDPPGLTSSARSPANPGDRNRASGGP